MIEWIGEQWIYVLFNSRPPGSTGKILYADAHTAQQTEFIKLGLQTKDTIFINVLIARANRMQ